MKPILIPTIAFISSIVVSMLLTRLVTMKRRKSGKLTRRIRIIVFTCFMAIFFLGGGFVYFSRYSHASEQAMLYMNGSDTVKVTETKEGYLFDGPGTEDALIFYPGAKVDEKAYAQLMSELADEGIDCFLVSMPFHMAFMGKNKAADVMEENSSSGYKHWYIGGHSLGGAMAGVFAGENKGAVDGVVMIAAYSAEKLSDDTKAMTILATNDHVIVMDDYENNKKNLPPSAEEVTIQGGNHSQFGDYGDQRGDGEATISRDEQIKQTCEAIVRLISPRPIVQTDSQVE